MRFKDVLHLYIGCEVNRIIFKDKYDSIITSANGGVVILQAVDLSCDEAKVCWYYPEFSSNCTHADSVWFPISSITPLLILLSDITEEDARELLKIAGIDPLEVKITEQGIRYNLPDDLIGELIPFERLLFSPNEFLYLLQRHYDVFNLIKLGLAMKIDRAQIKNKQ